MTGTHTVIETDPLGYISTTPNEVDVEVSLGEQSRVDFGDRPEGPCTCEADAYEDDDIPADANMLESGSGDRQAHDFCDDAVDWVKFDAQAGELYTITTSAWGGQADTSLALYDTDGQTQLATNDDHEGATDGSSQIVWEAPADGVYYVQVTNDQSYTGCETDYDIWAERNDATGKGYLYLPLVINSHHP